MGHSSMRFRLLIFAMAAMFASLSLLVGCATSPAAPSSSTAPTKTTGQASNPASASSQGAKAPSGTLTVALPTFGEDTMDPVIGGFTTTQAGVPFEALTYLDDKGKLTPWLATSWSESADGKSWTFSIRKGVKFQNGDDMTSADVKFSIERLSSKESRSPWGAIYRMEIVNVTTPDPYTVVITTKAVDRLFPTETTGMIIMPQKYIQEKGEKYFGEHPIGTSSWKLVSYTHGQTAEFEAVQNHWFYTPQFTKLVLKNVPEESTRMAMLQRGDIDMTQISLDQTDQVKSEGFGLRFATQLNQPLIIIPGTWYNNVKGPMPLMDPRIRQALSLAVNRDEMIKTFFKGYAQPATRIWSAPYSWGYDPSWKPDPYDPAKAKQLLAEAGYPKKFPNPVINLYSYQLAGADWLPGWVQIMSGYWEAIGLQTKITPIDAAAIRTMYTSHPADPRVVGQAVAYQATGNPFNLSILTNMYVSKSTVDLLHDPNIDALFNQVSKGSDEAEQIDAYRKASTAAQSKYTTIVTVNVQQPYAVSKKVGDWVPVTGAVPGLNYEGITRK